MSFITKYAKEDEDNFNSHISEEIKDKINKKQVISLEEYKEMRINGYEQKRILPLLSDDAFIWHIKNAIKNRGYNVSSLQLPDHYDHYLSTDGIDELLKRFVFATGGK